MFTPAPAMLGEEQNKMQIHTYHNPFTSPSCSSEQAFGAVLALQNILRRFR